MQFSSALGLCLGLAVLAPDARADTPSPGFDPVRIALLEETTLDADHAFSETRIAKWLAACRAHIGGN